MHSHIKDCFTRFLTSDIILQHSENKINKKSILPYAEISGGKTHILDDYSFIEDILNNQNNIQSFTPFSFYPATGLNIDKEKIYLWLKVIEQQSFLNVFTEISLTHIDETPIDKINGILLPNNLLKKMSGLLNKPLLEGDPIYISNDKAQIKEVREYDLAGTVSHRRYTKTFSSTAYTDIIIFKEKQINTDNGTLPSFHLQEDNTFYQELYSSKTPIFKTELPDSYFFEFFNLLENNRTNDATIPPDWHYIAVLLKNKKQTEQSVKRLNKQFKMNHQKVTAKSWKETAVFLLHKVFPYTLIIYIITGFFILILFYFSFHRIRTFSGKITSRRGRKLSDIHMLEIIKKETINRIITVFISAVTGISSGVLAVLILNTLKLPTGNQTWNTIILGGKNIYISFSLQPVLVSLIFVMSVIVIISVYPLILLAEVKLPEDNRLEIKDTDNP